MSGVGCRGKQQASGCGRALWSKGGDAQARAGPDLTAERPELSRCSFWKVQLAASPLTTPQTSTRDLRSSFTESQTHIPVPALSAMEARSRSSTDTLLSADAIEFSPDPHIFACGTYQIEKDETNATPAAEDGDGDAAEPTVSRFGRCLLYEVDGDGSNMCARAHQSVTLPDQLKLRSAAVRYNASTGRPSST